MVGVSVEMMQMAADTEKDIDVIVHASALKYTPPKACKQDKDLCVPPSRAALPTKKGWSSQSTGNELNKYITNLSSLRTVITLCAKRSVETRH